MSELDRVNVVMLRTTHPGNIGAAARAMGNMGISRISLADPRCDHTCPDAVARASGFGGLLDLAQVHPTLKDSIAADHHSYAFTARRRDLSQPTADVREASAIMAGKLAAGLKVAMVFGPEQSGLSNEETDLCDFIVEIPTEPDKASLNVAAAIQVACHELRMATIGPGRKAPARKVAAKIEVQRLVDHFEQMIRDTCPPKSDGLLNRMIRRLTMILSRAGLDQADVRMLRGLLSSVQKAKEQNGQRSK